MLRKMGNWFKGHRVSRVLLPCAITLLLVLALVVPYAMGALEYADVTGTYKVSSTIPAKYMDGSKHPSILSGCILTITTQTNQAISVATLTMPGKTVSLTGIVGPGSRPYISLTGNDTVGSYVNINGRVTKRLGTVTGISGRIEGFITSDGEKGTDTAGTAAHSTVAAYSGAYSALLTAGADEGSVYVQLHNPTTSLKVRDLSRLPSGYGFMFNLQDTKVYGPQIELRFTAATCTDPGGAGHVDVTIMPIPYPMTGDGTWKEFALTSATTRAIYYGNDPTDGTAFGSAVEYTLGEIPALIDAEVAMTAGGDSAARWGLTRVRIELWEAGARTCYIDDIRTGRVTYTLEPVKFGSSFKAKKQ